MSLVTVDLDYISKLNNKENFSFSRFGDGEWNCIAGKSGFNCDKHIYFKDLGVRLKDILLNKPNYYIGLQNLAYRLHTELIDKITKENSLEWCLSDILHHDSINGRLQPFFDALKQREVLLIGPKRLRQLNIYNHFIEIPNENCWISYNEIKKQVIIKDNLVILYCASMMSNVLIHDFNKFNLTQIDCGSLFEPYIGNSNRTYHNNLIKKLNEQNTNNQ